MLLTVFFFEYMHLKRYGVRKDGIKLLRIVWDCLSRGELSRYVESLSLRLGIRGKGECVCMRGGR